MRKHLLLLAMLMLSAMSFAQSKFNVSGTIIDKENDEALIAASVQVTDTAGNYVTGKATDLNGQFKLTSMKKGKYIIKISYVGYVTKDVDLDLTNRKGKDVDLGYITMSTDAVLLKEATVTAQAAKVQVKGDSLVFNADAYRLPPGSALEDLIKRLPGATIDEDGTVKINGKPVSKVLIDGKEFFVNDKNIAMKNIPTNIIDNIKAYDRKSDLARVTGIDDGEEETVLDLTVKKGMNNGWFGQINGGVGTEHRYNGRANINRFNDNAQYSLVTSANNIGDRGFGGGGGRGWGRFGGGNGLRASKELGFNYATTSDKLETGGYVWHRYDGSDAWSQSSSQNFVNSVGAFSRSVNQSYGSNANLSAGFRFEWKPDSMTNIIFRPNASYSRNRGSSYGNSGTYDNDPESYNEEQLDAAEKEFESRLGESDEEIARIADMIVNTRNTRQQTYSSSRGMNGELQLNRKLNNEGRNITLRLTGGFTNSESKQLSTSLIGYRESTGMDNDINNRYYNTPTRSRNYSIQTTYSEPIAKRTYLQFSYRFDYRYNKSDRGAFIYDDLAYNDLVQALRNNRYDIPGAIDELMSNTAGYTQQYDNSLSQFSEYMNYDHTASVMFRMVRDKFNLNFGVDVLPQHSKLNYKYMGKEYNDITRNVVNFTPTLNLRYKFNETTNLQVRYNGRTSQPSMTNLLEITDDSDPLNIRMGNSKLKPSFNQNLMAFFNTYDMEHQRGIFANIRFNMQQNAISNRTYYNEETGVSTTKPENINGNWTGNMGLGMNTALDKDKYFTMNTFTNFGLSHSVSYLDPLRFPDDDKSATNGLTLSQNLGFSFRKGWVELSVNGDVAYNHSKNNVITNNNLDTWTFSYGTELNVLAPWGTTLSTDIAMNSRRGYAQESMNTNELIWNASLSHSFFKDRSLTVSLEWNDILNERSNITRTINAMMRSDSRHNAIYSYGMVKVIYKLNIFGGKRGGGDYPGGFGGPGGWGGGRGGWGGGRPGGGGGRPGGRR